MATYDQEIAVLKQRIALKQSLNTLLSYNPDFNALITTGFLHDEVIAHSLNINVDKAATIQFLKGAATLKAYFAKVALEGEQAQVDLLGYQNLIQDAR